MLMGEFDFTANFINAEDTPFIAKIFFLIFILIMALVFMNLLLGLAVSDIGELERISKVRYEKKIFKFVKAQFTFLLI